MSDVAMPYGRSLEVMQGSPPSSVLLPGLCRVEVYSNPRDVLADWR